MFGIFRLFFIALFDSEEENMETQQDQTENVNPSLIYILLKLF